MNGMEKQNDCWANEELCRYLKERHFRQFMDLWKQQYIKYGTCKGSILLPINSQNQSDLENLMGEDYFGKKEVKISYTKLKKALKETRYAECDFNDVLMLYFESSIATKKEIKDKKEKEILTFFDTLMKIEGKSSYWIQTVYLNREGPYIRFIQEMQTDQKRCLKQLSEVMYALNALPVWEKKKMNLSVFASTYTKNPHAFDKGSFYRYGLIQGILFLLGIKKSENTSLEENEILYQAGLYQDGISNYCSIARLKAIDQNGQCHSGWEGFYHSWEALNINMDNLLSIQGIVPCQKVYIVENPSIFQALLKALKEKKKTEIALICTNGQLNYSAYLLLDLIQKAHISMVYSGDMDPEGLLIAQRLVNRYPSLHLWHYEIDDYKAALSNQKASEKRMQMLKQIQEEALCKVIEQMQENNNRIAYQENILKRYIDDL